MVVSLIFILAFSNDHLSKKSAKRGTKKENQSRQSRSRAGESFSEMRGWVPNSSWLGRFSFFLCVVPGLTQDALFGELTLPAAFLALAPLLLP